MILKSQPYRLQLGFGLDPGRCPGLENSQSVGLKEGDFCQRIIATIVVIWIVAVGNLGKRFEKLSGETENN